MKLWKKCPLLVLIAVSGLILELIGLANQNGIYADYRPDGPETPAMAAVFTAAKDGVFPWSGLAGRMEDKEPPVGKTDENGGKEQTGEAGKESPEGSAQQEAGGTGTGGQEVSGVSDNSVSGNSAGQENEGEITYSFTQVDESYFDDAAFIGDSRTQGLLEYGGIEDHADFYCKTSLTVYNLFEKPKAFIQDGNEKITLEEALTRHSYKKIYLMIGIRWEPGRRSRFLRRMRGRFTKYGSCSRTRSFSCRGSCGWRRGKTLPIRSLIIRISTSAM
mgnify:CR=1 FL=1